MSLEEEPLPDGEAIEPRAPLAEEAREDRASAFAAGDVAEEGLHGGEAAEISLTETRPAEIGSTGAPPPGESAAVVVGPDELVEPAAATIPPSSAEGTAAPHPIPGGQGRLIDVGFRPRGEIRVVPNGPSLPFAEQQPGLELPPEAPRDLVFRPERDGGGTIEQLPYRPDEHSRVFPPAVKLAGGAAREPTQEQLKAVPRLVVMVSLANARALFDDALQRAADTMAPRFQNLAKFEIDQYAFQRKSAERAVNPWMRGPVF